MRKRFITLIAELITPESHNPWRWELKNKILRKLGITIGIEVAIDSNFECLFGDKLLLEDNVVIGKNVKIYNFSDISIGKFCMFAGEILISNGGHNKNNYEPFSKFITIGSGCWVGAGAKIVGNGITIGNNAIVGAGALVNKDVPPCAVVAGIPAKIIGYRDLPDKVWHLGNTWFSPHTFEKLKKMITFPQIPNGSVLGINYSGMHDSAIAIVAPDGTPIYATALERHSRVKQDGRPPYPLLEGLPWEKISKIAVSTEKSLVLSSNPISRLLETKLLDERKAGLRHSQEFYDFFNSLPAEKEFVCHQMAHAASAFWGSGFEDSLCLTYDGGMCNSPWFGGLYRANRRSGISPLDQFSALHYAKATSLYTFITALLGFTPNKHEGKITGLAAYGTPSPECKNLLKEWFENRFIEIESVMEWIFSYDSIQSPMLQTNNLKIQRFREEASAFSREELAATVQDFAEQHIIDIINNAINCGWASNNICLAGGLFANVKINQRVVETGFKNIFIAPPMTDDGTALGAAWHVLSRTSNFNPRPITSMYLGAGYTDNSIEKLLNKKNIHYSKLTDPQNHVAELLASGAVVAIFQGQMEFGPRALGNRSILAQATNNDINNNLNNRLNRTEFMPFAPVSRIEDADRCYLDIDRVRHAAEFMTITVNCTDEMKAKCPAVVHIDGTARPQLVSHKNNFFIHGLLTEYITITGNPALVNTSFNIHEEPIVCTAEDAIQGFFESGLDYLYFDGAFLISFKENKNIAIQYLQKKIQEPNQKVSTLIAIGKLKEEESENLRKELLLKESVIQEQARALMAYAPALDAKEKVINELSNALNPYRLALEAKEEFIQKQALHLKRYRNIILPLIAAGKINTYLKNKIRPRLGNLNQYSPRPLSFQKNKVAVKLTKTPLISIVTPSFRQGNYIERTILSVIEQNYPNLEYYVQDGGSTDSTIEVAQKFDKKITSWVSEKDNGQSQAINLGFSKSNGEIMGWLNSDDLLLPGTLNIVADFFNRNIDVDVVYGNRLLIDEKDMEIGRWIMPGHDSEVLSWVDYIPQETMFWRRSIWEKVGGNIDESFRFAMDWDLLVRFRDAGAKFSHIPKFLGAFRIHESQKTSAHINAIGHQEMDRIRERCIGRIPNRQEINKNIFSYMTKHIMMDMKYRIKVNFNILTHHGSLNT